MSCKGASASASVTHTELALVRERRLRGEAHAVSTVRIDDGVWVIRGPSAAGVRMVGTTFVCVDGNRCL